MNAAALADAIDALLPQMQCRQCGYKACRPYAQAIAAGKADIDRCPPGGDEGIRALAMLLNREAIPLNTACGVTKAPAVALIDEQWCIGCTLCIQACPVDAIAGAAKFMHTVIADECTGCELCIPPCPVDCIDMIPVTRSRSGEAYRTQWRNRYLAREQRLAAQRATGKKSAKGADSAAAGRKRDTLAQALARAKARIGKIN